MKKLTTEERLDKLSHTIHVDGNGLVTMVATAKDSRGIDTILTKLHICTEIFGIPDENGNLTDFGYEFDLEEIRVSCPNLYTRLAMMKETNKSFKNN
jgi:hypothetical protein